MPRKSIEPRASQEKGTRDLDKITGILRDYGFIIESDQKLPSIVSMISGEHVKGSWWGHPKGHEIYQVLTRFSQQPDLLLTKLVNEKTTFIERKLWSQFLSIARSGARWQTDHLPVEAKRLFEILSKRGELKTDKYAKEAGLKVGDLGQSARILEKRLLIYGIGFHSYAGSHAKHLQSWNHWMKSVDYKPDNIEPDRSIKEFALIAARLEKEYRTRPKFPWDDQKRSS